MQVTEILGAKGSDVVTVPPNTPLSDITGTLKRHGIGAVLVQSDDKELLGILSERDIVRRIAEFGAGCLTQPASEAMTRDLVTCSPDTEIESLMEKMVASHIRHLPVMKNGTLVGIVSIGDVVDGMVKDLKWTRDALLEHVARSAAWATVED